MRNKLHNFSLLAFYETSMINSFYKWVLYYSFKPFHTDSLFLLPLKTSENLWFSDISRAYGKRPLLENGLTNFPDFSNIHFIGS